MGEITSLLDSVQDLQKFDIQFMGILGHSDL